MRLGLSTGSILISDQDYEWIKDHTWTVKRVKSKYPYVYRVSDGKALHRLIMDAPDDRMVDHINHDTLDNRRSNLRLVTTQQNSWNGRGLRGATSRYKGVNRNRRKWAANIFANGEKHYLGTYEYEEEAAVMYNLAAIKFFGSHAHLNEIT